MSHARLLALDLHLVRRPNYATRHSHPLAANGGCTRPTTTDIGTYWTTSRWRRHRPLLNHIDTDPAGAFRR